MSEETGFNENTTYMSDIRSNQALACPECGGQRLWKAGLRYLHCSENTHSVQRYLCRDCGYRFSEGSRVQISADPPHLEGSECSENVQNVDRQILNCRSALPSSRQVCELLTEDSKNLATSETQIQEQAAGATTQIADLKGKFVEFAWWMKKEAYSETTIVGRTKLLRILTKRGANLYDPETVKTTIAKQPWSEGRKANAVDAYTTFLRMTGGKWQPPRYQGIHKIPFIPTENEIDQIISGCSNRMATFVQLLKETGARCGEAWQLKWTDLDTATKTVRITPEKGSNPRIAKISPKLLNMLETLPKNYGERIFSNHTQPLDHHRDIFCQQRKRIAHKLQNPRILRITFHTLRHWKGTMEYHRTKDILYVKQILGHKRIENTLIYVQLAEELFKDQIDYVSKVAKTEGEACTLIEAGFEFICDFNGNKLFRKRKN